MRARRLTVGRLIRPRTMGWVHVVAVLSYEHGVTVRVRYPNGQTEVVTLMRKVQALGWDGKTID